MEDLQTGAVAPTGLAGRVPASVRVVVVLLFLAGLVGAIWYWNGRGAEGNAASEMPRIGSAAPAFSLQNADGNPVSLASFRGKTVIVNFWATWCQPCRTEMPAIDAVARADPTRVAVLAVDVMEGPVLVDRYRDEVPLSFVPLLDEDGAVTGRYHVSLLPTSVFVGPDGTVRAVNVGPMDRGTLDQDVAKARG